MVTVNHFSLHRENALSTLIGFDILPLAPNFYAVFIFSQHQ